MTTMTATAIITAVDRASNVFARVGASARAQAGVFTAGTSAMNRFTSATSAALGAGGMFAAALSTQGEYEIDKTSRLIQSAGELTASQRELLKKSSFDASLKSGVKALELLEAQREFIQGGLDTDTTVAMTETLAKVARANGMETKKVAEDAINVSNALGLAMGTTEEKVASLKKSMEFMSVVPTLSTESWEGLRTSLKHAAPVAGALKIPIEELGAALSILADAGFKGEEGGTALRTVLTRAVAPTRAARLEMRAAGIDLDDIYKFNKSKLGDMNALQERLLGSGLGQGLNLKPILDKFLEPGSFTGVYDFQDKMIAALSKALGIKKGDAEARGILQKVIGGHVQGATEGFDIEKYFKGIAKVGVPVLKEMFGLQRLSQAKKLLDGINAILKLPNGERISKFRQLAEQFQILMPGSIDRRFGPVSEGFAYQLDVAMAALTRFRNAVFSSGLGGGVTTALAALAEGAERLSNTNPQILRDLTIGIGALVALGPAAWVLRSIGGGLAMISTALASSGLARLAAAGGLGALLFGDMGKLFETTTFDPFGAAITPYDQLRASLGGLFGELGGAVKDVGSGVNSIFTGIQALFGFNGTGSVLLDSVGALVKLLETGTAAVRYWRETFPALFSGKIPQNLNDFMPEWTQKYRQSYEDGMNRLRSPSSIPSVTDIPGGVGRFAAPGLVNVQGNAEVKVQSEVTIKVDGPGTVTSNTPGSGTANVPLNTGKTMPDTGPMP